MECSLLGGASMLGAMSVGAGLRYEISIDTGARVHLSARIWGSYSSSYVKRAYDDDDD